MKYAFWAVAAIAATYIVYLVSPSHTTCGFVDWITQKCG